MRRSFTTFPSLTRTGPSRPVRVQDMDAHWHLISCHGYRRGQPIRPCPGTAVCAVDKLLHAACPDAGSVNSRQAMGPDIPNSRASEFMRPGGNSLKREALYAPRLEPEMRPDRVPDLLQTSKYPCAKTKTRMLPRIEKNILDFDFTPTVTPSRRNPGRRGSNLDFQ